MTLSLVESVRIAILPLGLLISPLVDNLKERTVRRYKVGAPFQFRRVAELLDAIQS